MSWSNAFQKHFTTPIFVAMKLVCRKENGVNIRKVRNDIRDNPYPSKSWNAASKLCGVKWSKLEVKIKFLVVN